MFRRRQESHRASAPAVSGMGGRAPARLVLGATLVVLLTVAGLPLGLSLAQVEPQIQIINPTVGTSLVLSDRQQAFNLNSWVNEVPEGARVEYELDTTRVEPNEPTQFQNVFLGAADRSGNAFEFLWDLGGLSDTIASGPIQRTYVLRAILYSGYTGPGTGTQIAIDEQPVTINHQDDADPTQHSPEDAGETVQITYPQNGGPLGVYIRQNGSGGNFTIEAIASRYTRFLRPFYTTSKPGEDPQWKSCGIAGGRLTLIEGAGVMWLMRIRCDLPAGEYALNVTGVAVVTNDTPSPTPAGQARVEFNDGADAALVEPYFQRAGEITIDHPTTDDVPTDLGCPQLVATVLDQVGRPIGNMNVDVHIQGPSDQIRFATIFPAADANNLNKPPDMNHPLREPAQSCLSGPKEGLSGKQAEHNLVAGLDTKHLESTDGTDLAGTFMFAVTADRAGGTQVTVWADEDNDDLFCADEVAGYASIGWHGPAPAPSGLPHDTAVCSEVPVPPPTPSPSPSASGPSPSATDGGTSFERNVGIEFSHAPLIVSGDVTGGPEACTLDVPVKVKRMKDGRFVTLEETRTDEHGRYRAQIADRTGRYRVVAPKTQRNESVCGRASVTQRHIH